MPQRSGLFSFPQDQTWAESTVSALNGKLRRKAPKWVVAWLVVFLIVDAVASGFPIFMYAMIQSAPGLYPKEAFTLGNLMTGVAINLTWWSFVALLPMMIAKRKRRPPVPLPVAENYMPAELLTVKAHGVPGRTQQAGLEVGEFIHTFGDAHIYVNHVDQVKDQLSHEARPYPALKISREPDSIFDYRLEDFEIIGCDPHPKIQGEVAV